jgi:hypothetical protein
MGDLLEDDHDLAVLRQMLTRDPRPCYLRGRGWSILTRLTTISVNETYEVLGEPMEIPGVGQSMPPKRRATGSSAVPFVCHLVSASCRLDFGHAGAAGTLRGGVIAGPLPVGIARSPVVLPPTGGAESCARKSLCAMSAVAAARPDCLVLEHIT